jgi:hypothetical protein
MKRKNVCFALSLFFGPHWPIPKSPYLHPELFGATEKAAIGAASPPAMKLPGHSGQREPSQPALEA